MTEPHNLFRSPRWYDASINWDARLGREIPLIREMLGPPGTQGILDAGCGTGRQAVALALAGYQVTGLDADEHMLSLARAHAEASDANVRYVPATYSQTSSAAPGPYDGVVCIGNALAACGCAAAVQEAIIALAGAMRCGGRLFLQVLNFPPMRDESPCLRGPRVVTVDGVAYVSTRAYRFDGTRVFVTNITHFQQDGSWHHWATTGELFAASPDEIVAWMHDAGLSVESTFGAYDKSPFDPGTSIDLIVVAARR